MARKDREVTRKMKDDYKKMNELLLGEMKDDKDKKPK